MVENLCPQNIKLTSLT